MASAKLAPILLDLVGSVGPDTFSHTRAVLALKAKSYPGSAHPFTPSQKQLDIRAMFAIPAAHWKTLDDTTIAAWCALAETLPDYNKFGDSYYQAGFNLYCQVQQNIQLIGGSIYDPAPLYPSITPLSDFSFLASGLPVSSLVIDFNGTTTDANVDHLIYCTDPVSTGRNYVLNRYRKVGILPASTANQLDISADYALCFPAPAASPKIYCKLIPIEKNTGFAVAPLIRYGISS